MGMDQTMTAVAPYQNTHHLPPEFFYWRKDYELHDLIVQRHPQGEEDAGLAFVYLTAADLDAIEQAFADRLTEPCGWFGQSARWSLLPWRHRPRTWSDFLRRARHRVSKGQQLIYAAG